MAPSARKPGKWRGRRSHRTLSVKLCADNVDAPAVGGIQVPDDAMTQYAYLPDYVVLWEPTHAEIWAAYTEKKKQRSIFLNQPLEAWEHTTVEEFRRLLKLDMQLGDDEELPRWILPHLTRLLQQAKYHPEKALSLWPTLLNERVKSLPINYADVVEGLSHGMVYFHGRDKCCRPLLTIRIGRAGPLLQKPKLIKPVFLYTMEFAVRYLLVPGRVEGWSVVIDCAGLEKLPVSLKMKEMANDIATALGKSYSGRMAWTKIFNFPSGFGFKFIKAFVESIVSLLGKSDKVAFVPPSDQNVLAQYVELGQLEKSFGGTAPDLGPKDVFPPRMFSTKEGYGGGISPRARSSSDFSVSSDAAPASMHLMTDLQFHEGLLCAECLEKSTKWKEHVTKLPLPKKVAEEFGGVSVGDDISLWCKVMADAAGIPRGGSAPDTSALDAPNDGPASITKEQDGAEEEALKDGASAAPATGDARSSQGVTSAAPATGEVQPVPEDGFGSGKATVDAGPVKMMAAPQQGKANDDEGPARASTGQQDPMMKTSAPEETLQGQPTVAAPEEKSHPQPPGAAQETQVATSGQTQEDKSVGMVQLDDESAPGPGCSCAVS